MSRFCVAAHFATLELYPQSNSVGLSPSFGPLEVQADCPFYPREQQHHLFSPRHVRSSFSHIPWKFSSMSQLYLGLVLHFSGDQMLDSSFFFPVCLRRKRSVCLSWFWASQAISYTCGRFRDSTQAFVLARLVL